MTNVTIKRIDGEVASITAAEIRGLADGFSGTLLEPGAPGYETAREVWNGMFDRRPGLIAHCATEEDIRRTVQLASSRNLQVAVKGGGHSVAGYSAVEGGLLIDLSGMRTVSVDPDRRLAVVEGGAVWADVDAVTQAYGLMTPGGEVSVTGVAGLTLGGGIGFARRKVGLSCDNMVAARVVTADGTVRTASEDENPELLWALRGGGGNFGVVSSFTFRLHELGPTVFGLSLAYPWEAVASVLRQWRDIGALLPKEASLNLELWSVPPNPAFPEELHGTPFVNVEGLYFGDPEVGARILDPLRRFAEPLWDESGATTYQAIQTAFDPFLPNRWRYYWKSHFLNDLDNAAVDRIVEWGAKRINPGTLIVLRQLGGAVAEVPEDATAFGNRRALYNLSIDNGWERPEDDEANIAWSRQCWGDLRSIASDGVYLNFNGDNGAALLRAGAQGNVHRLRAVKRVYDPGNLFRMNANIVPESSAAHLTVS